jgi:hypothetical protein
MQIRQVRSGEIVRGYAVVLRDARSNALTHDRKDPEHRVHHFGRTPACMRMQAPEDPSGMREEYERSWNRLFEIFEAWSKTIGIGVAVTRDRENNQSRLVIEVR